MNPVHSVADADSSFTPLWLRTATVLLVLFGCVSLRSAAQQQQAARAVVIDLSVVDDKGQAVPQARIEIRAQGQVLATALTDTGGRATATLQGRPSLQLAVNKQGYLATSTVLEIKANTAPMEIVVVLANADPFRLRNDFRVWRSVIERSAHDFQFRMLVVHRDLYVAMPHCSHYSGKVSGSHQNSRTVVRSRAIENQFLRKA